MRIEGTRALQPVEVCFIGCLGLLVLIGAVAWIFGPTPSSFAITFIAMPLFSVIAAVLLQRRFGLFRMRSFLGSLMMGGFWGMAAMIVYDLYSPLVKWLFHYNYDPFKAVHGFGHLITGLASTHPIALGTGWFYHLWIGALGGMVFALIRPQGGALAGLIWALSIQAIRLAFYSGLWQASLGDPEFLAKGVVGFGIWGIVLGAGLRKWRWHYA